MRIFQVTAALYCVGHYTVPGTECRTQKNTLRVSPRIPQLQFPTSRMGWHLPEPYQQTCVGLQWSNGLVQLQRTRAYIEANLGSYCCVTSGLPRFFVFVFSFLIVLAFVRSASCNFYFYIIFVSQIVIILVFVLLKRSAIILVFVFVFVTKIAL